AAGTVRKHAFRPAYPAQAAGGGGMSDTQVVYDGKWLRRCKRGRWEYVERTHADGMAVVVIAGTPGDEVPFAEQVRIPLGKRTIEMPAGLIGDQAGEDTLEDAARRELIEETGWEPAHVEVLLTGPTSSGMSNERIAFVRASGLTRVGPGGGDD